MTITAEEKLLLQREHLLEELSNLSVKARALVMEFRILDRKILLSSAAGDPFEWSKYRLAKDVILAYLEKKGKAVPLAQMQKEIAAGGWSTADYRAEAKVKESVMYHCHRPRGMAEKRLRQVPKGDREGLVGLYEWPDSKFKG